MSDDGRLALFLLLGKTASRAMDEHPETADSRPLLLSASHDLAGTVPEIVRQASTASEAYRLFFVFESYLRDIMVRVLSSDGKTDWWEKVPPDVKAEVLKNEDTEVMKKWMALGSRDRSALMTYPQILRVIEENWGEPFEEMLRDKALIQEARHIAHLRNTICHMSALSEEEMERVRQVMRDWFRIVSP